MPSVANTNKLRALVALNQVVVPVIVLAQLVSQGEPALANVVISTEQLDLPRAREHSFDNMIQLFWLLRLLSRLGKNHIVVDFRNKLQKGTRRGIFLDANKANL